ncbi:histidine kinase, partial [Halobium palmae]
MLRHNLRNDMNVILGYLDELAADLDDPDHREAVRLCRERGEHLVEQGKKVRGIERVLTESEVRPLDLGAIVDEVIDDYREAHPEATITASVPAGTTVRADESLPEALSELVGNAIRHGDGAVEVVDERTVGTV